MVRVAPVHNEGYHHVPNRLRNLGRHQAIAPFNVSNTISATALSYTMWKMPTVGVHTFSLVANAKNQAGAATASTPVT